EQPPVARRRGLDIGRHPLSIGAREHRGHQRRADALTLPLLIHPDQPQVIESTARVMPIEQVYEIEKPARVRPEEAVDANDELRQLIFVDGLPPGWDPHG